MANDDIWRLLLAAGPTDLRRLQIKLTYVGSQRKAVPSLAFTSCYHLLRPGWFEEQRRPGLNYANDDLDIWTFTAMPEQLAGMVRALASLLADPSAAGTAEDAEHADSSLMVVQRESRLGDVAGEVLLTRAGARRVLQELDTVLRGSTSPGPKLLAQLREAMPA